MLNRSLIILTTTIMSISVLGSANLAMAVDRVYSLGTQPVASTANGDCSFIEGRWRPGSIRAEGFYPFEIVVQNTKKAIRKAKGARKRSLELKLSRQRKALKKRIKACSTLSNPASTPTPITASQPPSVVVDKNVQFRLVDTYSEEKTSELVVTFEVLNKDTSKSVVNIREGVLSFADGTVKKSDALAYISTSKSVRSFAANSSFPLDSPPNTTVFFSYIFNAVGKAAAPTSVLVNSEPLLKVAPLTLTSTPTYRAIPFARSSSNLNFILVSTSLNTTTNEIAVFYDVENIDSGRSVSAFSKSTLSDSAGVTFTSDAFINPAGQTESFTGRSSISLGTPFGVKIRIGYIFKLKGTTDVLSTLTAEGDIRLRLDRVPVPYNG